MTARPMRCPSMVTAVLVAAMAFNTTVAQASTWGAVRGEVVDPDGEPIAGVRISVFGVDLQADERTAVSDAKGRFHIASLPPVTVAVTARGVDPQTRAPLVATTRKFEVPAGGTARVFLVLGDSDRANAPKTWVAPLSSGDVAPTWRLTPTFSDRVVTNRTPAGLALFAPGVVASPTVRTNPSIHGAGGFANQLRLDGARLTDPVLGTVGRQLIPFDAIRATTVITAGLDAEHGFLTGGMIDVVSRSGSDEFVIDGSAYLGPGALALTDVGEPSPSSELFVNALASGPIIKRKLWFLASATIGDESEPAGLGASLADLASIIQQSQRGVFAIGKLSYRPFQWQDLSLTLAGDPNWGSQTLDEVITVAPEAERQRFGGGLHAALTSTTQLARSLIL